MLSVFRSWLCVCVFWKGVGRLPKKTIRLHLFDSIARDVRFYYEEEWCFNVS